MNILQDKTKQEYNEIQKKLLKLFQFNKENIEIKGSSKLSNIDFFADYDFFSDIRRNYDKNEIYNEFHKILNTVLEGENTYFIEFKIQTNDNKKIRWYPNDIFDQNKFDKIFNNVDFCKLDVIIFDSKIFIESSCIYKFSSKKLYSSEYINILHDEIKELKKGNDYFKVLKKIFLINILKNDETNIQKLIKIFNSQLGAIYKKVSNIKAIEHIKKYYHDSQTKKKIEFNLSELGYPNNYTDAFNKDKKILNKDSKELYDKLF